MKRDPDTAATAAGESFLQRWSRRKHTAFHTAEPLPAGHPGAQLPITASSEEAAAQPGQAAAPAQPQLPEPPVSLPPVDSLTFDSDFRAFLQPHVAEDLKRQALRKLLHDPRFNVMDGLDVYIEDYSTPSPLEPAIAASLVQARYIFDPPPTRVNAAGHVEDVPPEAVSGEAEGDVAALTPDETDNLDTPPAGADPSAHQSRGGPEHAASAGEAAAAPAKEVKDPIRPCEATAANERTIPYACSGSARLVRREDRRASIRARGSGTRSSADQTVQDRIEPTATGAPECAPDSGKADAGGAAP